jgi:alpha-tubulin suppressor-like RCC1 family protein|tara:strand:+ start:16 stop:1215 length:1200 start_codon:yes stop_codon:yes gene_type:complete
MPNVKKSMMAAAGSGGVEGYDLFTWGWHGGGGHETTNISTSSPVQVGDKSVWTRVQSGQNTSRGLQGDGSLWTWGGATYMGDNGVSADAGVSKASSPVQVGSSTDWASVHGAWRTAFLTKSDGSLWTWGQGSYGQLGTGTVLNISSPTQIGSLTDWGDGDHHAENKQMLTKFSNNKHCLAIKTDGTLWSWGYNSSKGMCGDGTAITRSSPVQIGTDTNWAHCAAGEHTSFAIKTTGALFSWGGGQQGRLGNNSSGNTGISSPVQVGALTDWKQIGAGKIHTHAIKTDGTLWYVGGHATGGVNGIGHTGIVRSSPTQIGSDTNWAYCIHSGHAEKHAGCIKTDGTLWLWGAAGTGRMGLGDNIDYSSPVQVGSETDWLHAQAHSTSATQGVTFGLRGTRE